jgi:hypothetical protein
MGREYSTDPLWSKVGGKVVIPEAIAEYLESFETVNDPYMTARAVHCIAQVGFGHSPEDRHENKWKFSEDEEDNLNYRRMFGADRNKFDIIRAVLDGYVVHAPKVAVRFGTKFVTSLEVDTGLTSSAWQWMTYQEDEYGCTRSYTLTLSDYPEPWNYKDALRLSEDFGGEIVKYG